MSARRRRALQVITAAAQPKPEPEVVDASKTTVQLFKQPALEWPELYVNVYISEPSYEQAMGAMFGRARCYRANTVDGADIVVFCGGADVNPNLYEEEAHESYSGDDARDKRDLDLYLQCVEKGIPMVGICRGAQFGHVMNRGKLIQDMDGHNKEHGMIITAGNHHTPSMYIARISSTHHQAVIENNEMKVLGHVHLSERRELNPSITQAGRTRDIEAFFYPKTCFLGLQGHPEYAGYYMYTQWCLQMIEKYIANNPNVELDDNKRYRLKKEKTVILGIPGPINNTNK